MKIYIPGEGGAFRSIITQPEILIPEKSKISSFELEYLADKAIVPKFVNKTKQINAPVSFYAYDQDTCTEAATMLASPSQKINLNGSIVSSSQIHDLVKFSKTLRDKTYFYKLVKKMSKYPHVTSKFYENFDSLKSNAKNIFEEIGFPMIIKSIHSKGGKGNLVCYTEEHFELSLLIIASKLFAQKTEYKKCPLGSPFIIEEYFHDARAFNCTFLISKDLKHHCHVSEQIIEEVFYRGNKSLETNDEFILKDIKEFSRFFRNWAIKKFNFNGWVGIDFLLLPDNTIFPIEINPRINNVSHSFHISKKRPFELALYKYIGNSDFSGSLLNSLLTDMDLSDYTTPYQISNQKSIMLLTIAKSISELSIIRERLSKSETFLPAKQDCLKNLTKSLSYYIQRIKL